MLASIRSEVSIQLPSERNSSPSSVLGPTLAQSSEARPPKPATPSQQLEGAIASWRVAATQPLSIDHLAQRQTRIGHVAHSALAMG